MSGCPTHGDEASLLRAALPASDGTAGTPGAGAGFSEAQAEQALWQGFHDHIASLNRALSEALRIHGGLAWRIF
jgi:hypothetical protein